METMAINLLTWDKNTWPRSKAEPSAATVEAYKQALEAGANFPAIEVQDVANYPNGNDGKMDATLIIDGVHRWHAYKESDREEIDTLAWIEERIDYEDRFIDIILHAAERNAEHGDRTSDGDKKATARTIATRDTDGKYTEQQIADKLKVSQQTVNGWIGDIRAKQKAGRDAEIHRLNLLGWTQTEIGECSEISQGRVAQIISSTDFGKINNFVEQGESMRWIAEHYGLDLTTTWALRLRERDDEARMKQLEITIKKYNVWNYTGAHDLMGSSEFGGRIPGQIVANALYWFTNQGDRILDPMAGGGTTLDACLLMGRRCYGYDLHPQRSDIITNDIRDGYPEGIKRPDFIFVDPPYWNMKAYNEEEEDAMSLDEFHALLRNLATHSYALLGNGGKMAVLMGNQAAHKWLPEGVSRLDHIQTVYETFTAAGFKKAWSVWVPMPTEGAQRWAQAEWNEHRMAEITRELSIWTK